MSKIVIMTAGRDPQVGMGGNASYLRAHARAAMAAGYEPHIFFGAAPDVMVETDFGYVHRSPAPPLPAFAQNWSEIRHATMGWWTPRMAARIIRFLDRAPGPCVMHSFSTYGNATLLARDELRRRGAAIRVINSFYTTRENEAQAKARASRDARSLFPRVFHRMEYEWTRGTVMPLERRVWREADVVTLNYESVRRLFTDTHGPRGDVRRLPYASEAAFLHAETGVTPAAPAEIARLTPADAPLIVAVSRHDPRKGLDVLLRALGRLRAGGERFRACLVSGGALLGEHRRLAAELGLADITALTGWVPDPYVYLRHADIYALPSLQEASGSVAMLEAMQAGVAIVASDIDGIPEDIEAGENGLLVEAGNVAALADALRRLLQDADLRTRLARRARDTYATRFSAPAMTQALGDLYAEFSG
ncbi:MAG: glycosyltransferase [Blastocatellia bacterium]